MKVSDAQKRLFEDENLEIEKNLEDKPNLESTTLWDYPTQSYGKTPKGDNKFQGVTPAFIIYNMIMRYTKENDIVLDPMCGSGTTIDVCKEEGRRSIGFDIHPIRSDIIKNDSRKIPLENNSIDMVFIDSPYGDNVNYSNDPENIGNISAESEEFYIALRGTAKELYRVLKPGKVLGWLIGDQWVRKRFTPVGFKIYEILTEDVKFIPMDVVAVVRRNQSSNTKVWHYRAVKFNFYLRGFKYLFIVRKPNEDESKEPEFPQESRKANWQKYK